MKTNQLMGVNLGKFGVVHVWHKDMMGKLEDVAILANNANIMNGEKPFNVKKKVRDFLENINTWNFIIEVNRKRYENIDAIAFSTNREILDQLPRMSNGKIKYSEVFKQKLFNNVIRNQTRGKKEKQGVWANLYILLDFATQLNVKLKYEMYRVFIEEKILQHRDNGGDSFKKLNRAIDTLPDRQPHLKPKGNKGVYINIAKLIRDKLNILESRGYNQEEHNAKVQESRDKIEDTAVNLIKMKMISSYPQLKTFIINFPI